jgi:pimeloyl-ACP methyl ester carboxylesterase
MVGEEFMKQLLRKMGLVAGTIAMAGLTAPLIVPLPPLENTVSPETLAGPECEYLKIGAANMRYRRRGSGGRAFILLHGYLRTIYSWGRIFEQLADLGTVVAYDRPGFGLSSRPMPGEWKGKSPYGTMAQANVVMQVMQALDIEKPILIGHGMGARIAAMTASLHPGSVDGLILVGPHPPRTGRPAWQRLFMATPQMRRLGPVLLRGRVSSQLESIVRGSWLHPESIPSEMIRDFELIFRAADWDRGFWELARASESADKGGLPKSLRLPTLIIAGEKDTIADTESIIRMTAEIPDAHLALIPDAGHAPHEEAPGPFLQALQEFLEMPHSNPHAAAPNPHISGPNA